MGTSPSSYIQVLPPVKQPVAAVNNTIILYLTVTQKSIPIPTLDKPYSSLFENKYRGRNTSDQLDAVSSSRRQPIKTKRAVVVVVFVPEFYS